MTAKFTSLGDFATFLRGRITAAELAAHTGLEVAGKIIADEAKHEIGTYQTGWAPLSSATLEGFTHYSGKEIPGKIELGYAPPDNPLLRTGDLRDSIGHQVEGPHHAVVGSASDKAVWQELGTADAAYPIPPRSFLGHAAIVKGPEAVTEIGRLVFKALSGV